MRKHFATFDCKGRLIDESAEVFLFAFGMTHLTARYVLWMNFDFFLGFFFIFGIEFCEFIVALGQCNCTPNRIAVTDPFRFGSARFLDEATILNKNQSILFSIDSDAIEWQKCRRIIFSQTSWQRSCGKRKAESEKRTRPNIVRPIWNRSIWFRSVKIDAPKW